MADDLTKQQESSEKEEFDVGLDDKQLLTQIDEWETEAGDFYSLLERIWEENIAYYKGFQTGVEKIRGKQSRAVENRIFMAVETTVPIASAQLPDIVVKAGQEDEQSQIDAFELQDVLAYGFERVQIQALAEKFLRDMLIKRYGVFKVYWDKELDDVGLRVIDPRRIKIPKYGSTIDELAFIIEELELSYSSLVVFFGKAKANEVLKEGRVDTNTKIRKKTYLVKEIRTNEFVVWRYGNIILKKSKNEYYDFDNEENNFFTHPKKPYVIRSLFETEECIIGDTDYIQQLKPIQDNINIRKRQIENITGKVSNPPLLIDSDVMSEEEASSITNEEGLILYGKDAALGTKIRFEQPGQVSQALFTDLELSRQEFDNIWGLHSTTRGERTGRETLGGRQILREADLGRIDLVARQLERALDEVAEYWTQLIKLYYTEEKAFTIMGEDGMRFINSFTGAKVGKGVKPMVKAGSTLKEDEYSIQQKAILLWQNKAIGVRTLYKMLRLPSMQQALDDFIETQSGAIMQGQGQGGALALPPEQPIPV